MKDKIRTYYKGVPSVVHADEHVLIHADLCETIATEMCVLDGESIICYRPSIMTKCTVRQEFFVQRFCAVQSDLQD